MMKDPISLRLCWRPLLWSGTEHVVIDISYTGGKNLILSSNDQIAFELPDLEDQYSLMLCWRSFSEWGREHVAHSFAYKASQYLSYEWPQQIAMQITQDARPKILDAPLTLILPWVYPQSVVI